MARPRKTGVLYILEEERDRPASEQTVWVIDEPDHFTFEEYQSSTQMKMNKTGRKLTEFKIPLDAKVNLLVKCIKEVRNFGGKDYMSAGEIRGLFKSQLVHPSQMQELIGAVSEASILSEGEVKNSDASSGSSTSSETTDSDE